MARDADMRKFLSVCLALTAERDREALLSSILDAAMDFGSCDAGTLYLLEDDGLRFCRMVTRSQGVRQGGHDDPITLPPVPMKEKYVCAWSALHNKSINVRDVHTDTTFDFTGSIRYDAMTGYRTKSMLVVPMANDRGELIGVMQLINAQNEAGETIAFDPEQELLISAVASQAAISITNMQYAEQINTLLNSLVGALSTAIDERSHYNANHTRNMVRFGERFLDWLEQSGSDWHFDENKRRAFLMSVWLHDVGKLVVPLEVMDKASRLGARLGDVREHFRTAGFMDHIALLEGRLPQEEYDARQKEREDALAFIEQVNRTGFLPDKDLAMVEKLAKQTYRDDKGEEKPLLTEEERTCLSIRKGTLTDEERSIMQSHVTVTGRILSQVTFPKMYANVPVWAAMHHELLNGNGYPNHVKADEIPPEVRLLTILDVFEAMTARDRPYKPPMPLERALGILHIMAEKEGSIDPKILALFEQSKAWEGIVE